MAFDRVRETSTTTGTGALTLAGAPTGFRAFASVYTPGAGVVISYVIEGVTALGVQTGEWEVGTGTLAGDGTFTRSAVIASSNAGALVSFSAGTKRVFDAATVGAVAAVVATHAAATDPHGDRAFASAIATTTPAAGAVPKAGADGRLGSEWRPHDSAGSVVTTAYGVPSSTLVARGALTPIAVASGTAHFLFFEAHDGITISAAAVDVSAGAAGGVLELGLYNATRTSGVWTLGSLVASFGSVSVATTGTKSLSGLSTPLVAGRCYALAVAASVLGASYRMIAYWEPGARIIQLTANTFRRRDGLVAASGAVPLPADGSALSLAASASNSTTPDILFPMVVTW